MRTRKLIRSRQYLRNADREGGWPCAVCGKRIEDHENAPWLHLINGGDTILHPDDEELYEDDGGDVGCYPVGPECVKKYKGWTSGTWMEED